MVTPYANTQAGTTGTSDIMPVTNALEHLNREFRRRTKTQASFSTEAAALTVLFGWVAVGQIVFRKIDGHQGLAAFLVKEQWSQAA